MSLNDVKDQPVPVRLLRNIIIRKRIPNGLLFWGPEGVGKQFAAREFIKALNCKDAPGEGCQTCVSCRKITNGNHADMRVVAPKSKTRLIVKEQIEELVELCAYRPFEAAQRVVLVEDAECMNISAQNHFLKTLEEPPSQTMFILMTTAPRKLLPTIRSRCQQVRFGALKPETVKVLLARERNIPQEVAEAVAAVSQGQMSRAFDLVDSDRRTAVIDLLCRLGENEDPVVLAEEFAARIKADEAQIKARVEAEGENSQDLQHLTKEELEELDKARDALISGMTRRALLEYLYLMKTWYRDVLVFHSTSESGIILNMDMADKLKEMPRTAVDAKLEAIEKSWTYIDRNIFRDRVFRDLFCALSA